MDGARLEAGGVDGIQHLVELLQLAAGLRIVALHAVELSVDALQGHIGQGAVGQEDLFRLVHQKAAEAHAGVHLDVGAGDGGPGLCQGVEGQAGIHGGDGAYHVQVHQVLQLLPVGGGAEHEDLLVHEAGLAQLLRLLHIAHGEAADPLRPEEPGHGNDPRSAAVAGEHPVDDCPLRTFLDDGQVVLDCGLVDDQLAHRMAPFCLCRDIWAEILSSILPPSGRNSNMEGRDGSIPGGELLSYVSPAEGEGNRKIDRFGGCSGQGQKKLEKMRILSVQEPRFGI